MQNGLWTSSVKSESDILPIRLPFSRLQPRLFGSEWMDFCFVFADGKTEAFQLLCCFFSEIIYTSTSLVLSKNMMLWIHWWIPWAKEEIIRERVGQAGQTHWTQHPWSQVDGIHCSCGKVGFDISAKMVEIIGWNYPPTQDASHHQDFHF